MKSLLLLVAIVLALAFFTSFAIADVDISLDLKTIISDESGELVIPIKMKGFTTIRAARIVVKYEGTVENVTFQPTDYLNAPLILPIRIDRDKRTLDFSITATNRVVTRSKDGVLGYLRFSSGSKVTSYVISHAEYIDESYKAEVLVDNTSDQKDDSMPDNVDDDFRAITKTQLFQNFPNPSNPTTMISFDLKDRSLVRLEVFNVSGQHIRTLVNSTLNMDHYEVEWGRT